MPYVVRSTPTAADDREKTRRKKKKKVSVSPACVFFLASSLCPIMPAGVLQSQVLLLFLVLKKQRGHLSSICSIFFTEQNSILSNLTPWSTSCLMIELVSVPRMHVIFYFFFVLPSSCVYGLCVTWHLAQCAKHGPRHMGGKCSRNSEKALSQCCCRVKVFCAVFLMRQHDLQRFAEEKCAMCRQGHPHGAPFLDVPNVPIISPATCCTCFYGNIIGSRHQPFVIFRSQGCSLSMRTW